MRQPNVGDQVRLTRGIPNLWLYLGEVGTVCSKWSDPTLAFEVEFHSAGKAEAVRALVLGEHLELDAKPHLESSPLTVPLG